VAHFVPHSFLFAILLTFIAYFLGVFVTYQGPFDMVKFWVNGVWNLLSFSMQMVLMVAAGFSVASAPVSQKMLRSLAVIFRTPRIAAMFLTVLTAFCSLLHWGLGIITGAFLAREMGRRIPRIDYPLLVAGAFIGMGAGNLGVFASDPLVIRRAGYFLEKAAGIVPAEGSWSAATITGFILGVAAATAFVGLIYPEESESVPPAPEILERFDREDQDAEVTLAAEREIRRRGKMSLGMWLEHSRWPVWLISIMGFSYIVFWFYGRGFALNLNILTFILFTLALSLHDTPMHFLMSMERSARAANGIIVQFPFYAGTQGMLASSGLVAIFYGWIASAASQATFPTLAYIDGVILNLFAPASESVWGIQAPLMVKTAETLNASLPRAIQAISAGETIGNVIHPFWTIPLMGICGLSVRDIMGYSLMAFVILSVIWVLCFNFLAV
jgi:short-chain fatty acids transporter